MNKTAIWDCHVHVIGNPNKYPLNPDRNYDPPLATVDNLVNHLDVLNINRAVIVQPSVYGFDNSCLLDALDELNDRCVGVAVPSPQSSLQDLAALDRSGVCGVRCNLINPGGLKLEQTRAWWSWMKDNGWHLQIQVNAAQPEIEDLLDQPDAPQLVIDHMGFPPKGLAASAMQSLTRLVANHRAYVKLSAPYRISALPPPHQDALAIATMLLQTAPERCLFATDWPHTELTMAPMADSEWQKIIRDIAGRDWIRIHRAASYLYSRDI
ncbi:amidohydrolase family protein [Qingshengfaniella alkalisoli]|uniref:Amidohydrolase family protein n=1 Tax=Qingshengfaniella alkalisoli TaxID=2599296 RepID=A0A5B8IXS3_9RHOB|nr:amidohydrolase family protein [Qingshengfaniella alkalisoli]QDY70534.1 amidohydrolase family protein [Qingshengfaniella alkalisoli]